MTNDPPAPDAATQAPAGAAGHGASTLIRLEGRDCLSVLHRISTASLEGLEPGQARSTLFCDFRGRLLHRAAVAVTSDGAVWLLRPDAPAAELIEHVEHHVFREEVTISDRSAGHRVRLDFDTGDAPPETLAEADGIPARVRLGAGSGLRMVDPHPPADQADERRRIDAGLPRHGHEVHPNCNPFEVGLAHEVHLAKGCFTGQEALMRLITYRSVRRRLGRVSGAGAPPAVPSHVSSAGKVVGRLTSVAAVESGWIGLAVVTHEAFGAGQELGIHHGGSINGPIPFPETRPLGLP